jgi:hypothetical protein
MQPAVKRQGTQSRSTPLGSLGASKSHPRAPTSQHDTLGTLPGRAGLHFPDPESRQRFWGLRGVAPPGAAGGRFWHGFAVRTAAGMAAPGEAEGQGGGRDFGFGRCSRPSPWTTRMQRNVRAQDRWQRAASLAGGGRSRLWAFAAGGLPGDCAGGVAGGAAVQPPSCSARRAGALDRRAHRPAGGCRAGVATSTRRRFLAGQPASAARRERWA